MKLKKLVVFVVMTLAFNANSVQAGLWDDIKKDAAKAWEDTKSTASGVAEDGKESYEKAEETSVDGLKKEVKDQGVKPVKPKEDEAGLPVD